MPDIGDRKDYSKSSNSRAYPTPQNNEEIHPEETKEVGRTERKLEAAQSTNKKGCKHGFGVLYINAIRSLNHGYGEEFGTKANGIFEKNTVRRKQLLKYTVVFSCLCMLL